ncbi:IS1016 group transposase [Neisseria meningitidis]|nr:IS1016 group transposase [Neisseria meningitidis]
MPDSIVYTDSLSSCDKLDVSGFIHYRINHSKEFADRQNHINGIENFWNQAKRVLRKYNGIDCKSFPLFLKECEFRFNFGTPSQQLKILRDWCGDSIVYTDSLSSCDKLDVSGFIHYRINHSKEFADRQNHINGIENFWNQAKRVLRKYSGLTKTSTALARLSSKRTIL